MRFSTGGSMNKKVLALCALITITSISIAANKMAETGSAGRGDKKTSTTEINDYQKLLQKQTETLKKYVAIRQKRVENTIKDIEYEKKKEPLHIILRFESQKTIGVHPVVLYEETADLTINGDSLQKIAFTYSETTIAAKVIRKRIFSANPDQLSKLNVEYYNGPFKSTLTLDQMKSEKKKQKLLRIYRDYLDKLIVKMDTQIVRLRSNGAVQTDEILFTDDLLFSE